MDINQLFGLKDRVALVTGGSRGIGRMIAEGLLAAGCERVYVSARRWQSDRSGWDCVAEFEALGAQPIAWGPAELGLIASQVTTLVQATSAGMRGVGGGDELVAALPWQQFGRGVFAYDVVYNPERTPFLERCGQLGLGCEGGLSMLVGQAALAIELWLGIAPPLERLMASARTAIFGHKETKS